MESDGERLAEHAGELLSAALEIADSAADPSTAAHLPAALARVGEALDALSLALERAPRALVPAGDPREPICRRFERDPATLRLSRRACAHVTGLLVDMTAPSDVAAHHRAAVSSWYSVIR